MSRSLRIRLTLFLTVMAWMAVLAPAQAYIDPGSTSMIFQAVVAGFAAAGTGLAIFWGRIKAFFTRNRSTEEPAEADRSSEKV